jgi:hypothetical protein
MNRRFDIVVSVDVDDDSIHVDVEVNGDEPSTLEVLGALTIAQHQHRESKNQQITGHQVMHSMCGCRGC